MTNKPLKRNEHLVPLSREHHGALLLGWKIKKGLHNGTDENRIKQYINWFWENHLHPHQQEEERLLFLDKNDELVQQAIQEHRDIETLILNMEKTNSGNYLLDIAKAVESHIRFEERILFPHLEQILDKERLEQIGNELHNDESHNAKENYEDPFWEKNNL